MNFFNLANSQSDNSSILWRPAGSAILSDVYGTLRIILDNPKTGQIHLAPNIDFHGGFDQYDFPPGGKGEWLGDHLWPGTPQKYDFYGYGRGVINTAPPTIDFEDNTD